MPRRNIRFGRFGRLGIQAVTSLLVVTGCSWTVFSDFKKDPPIFAFTNRTNGQGVTLVYTPERSSAFLVSYGDPGDGGHTYDLGDGSADPSGDPTGNDAFCALRGDFIAAGRPCVSARKMVGLGALKDGVGVHPNCLAVGYGKLTDSGTVFGPVAKCTDGQVFTLGNADSDPGTMGTGATLARAMTSGDERTLRAVNVSFASLPIKDGASGNQSLLFGDEPDNAAYYYVGVTEQAKPILVGQPTTANRFGAAVALGTVRDKRLLVVGAPGAGKVYAYRIDAAAPTKIEHVACAGDGVSGSGNALAVGDVDGDGIDDLLVAQGSGASALVQVYSGADFPTTAAKADCDTAWKPSSIVLKCEETMGGALGCGDASFGTSIAIGDLDKDGMPEVAVGAPGASPEGNAGAGVVFLYTPKKGSAVLDVRYLGKPDSGAHFGVDVVIGKIGAAGREQDTLAVAASGKAATYLVWCTNLPGAPRGAHCRK